MLESNKLIPILILLTGCLHTPDLQERSLENRPSWIFEPRERWTYKEGDVLTCVESFQLEPLSQGLPSEKTTVSICRFKLEAFLAQNNTWTLSSFQTSASKSFQVYLETTQKKKPRIWGQWEKKKPDTVQSTYWIRHLVSLPKELRTSLWKDLAKRDLSGGTLHPAHNGPEKGPEK